MANIYTGIGSRETPPDVQEVMTQLSKHLDGLGFTLRSGGADGADIAFEKGSTNKEIYLPWRWFNGSHSNLYEVSEEAMEIASTVHPKWNILKKSARLLHGRNVYQVLGLDLNTPTDFVICWTIGGKIKGGTSTTIRIAMDRGIPVYNLYHQKDIYKLGEHFDRIS